MTFNIAQWKEGDDPQLIIDFINEVMDDLRPSYSQPGWFSKEQVEEICKKYEPTLPVEHAFSFYDGKILSVTYKDVDIHFQKDGMMYVFDFENIFVGLYEDWRFVGETKYYNDSGYEERYNSTFEGFEGLQKIVGIGSGDITVVVEKSDKVG